MREFMMLMKGSGGQGGDWATYIETLKSSGKFRGGSSLANGVAFSQRSVASNCTVTGFMRFEAQTIDDVRELLDGNPLYEAGGDIEILELVKD